MDGELERLHVRMLQLFADVRELTEQSDGPDPFLLGAIVTTVSVGHSIRHVAADFLCSLQIHPVDICARRLRELAAQSGVLCPFTLGSGPEDAGPLTWRGLQLAQAEHRSACGPLGVQLSLFERMRQYAIYLPVLAERLRSSYDKLSTGSEELLEATLADLLLLGVTLATDVDQELPDRAIPTTHHELEAALMEHGLG